MLKVLGVVLLATLPVTVAVAQPQAAAGPWDPASRTAAQREAMKALAVMDGEWRGPAHEHAMTQTERVGALLDGTIRLVEGRGYTADGKTVFNAFAVISFDPVKKAYAMRSYSSGYAGDFPLAVTADGWSWSQPIGPGAKINYTATFTADGWREVGERVSGDGPPVKVFEMTLKRGAGSAWPAGVPVKPN